MLPFIPYLETASAEEFLPSLAAVVPDGTRLQTFSIFCGSNISAYFMKLKILCLLSFWILRVFSTLECRYFIGSWNQIDILHGKLIVMSKFVSGYSKKGRVNGSLSLLFVSRNSRNCGRLIPRLRSTADFSRSLRTTKCPRNVIN
jgi:hypothetical protein